jgi:hypothetical protein
MKPCRTTTDFIPVSSSHHRELITNIASNVFATTTVGVSDAPASAGTRARSARRKNAFGLFETDNIFFITSPELAVLVVTGDAQFVFVSEQNTEGLSCTHLLHATIDDFHEFGSLGFCPIPELAVVVKTRGPHTAIRLHQLGEANACRHLLHATATTGDFHKFESPRYCAIAELAIAVETHAHHTAI